MMLPVAFRKSSSVPRIFRTSSQFWEWTNFRRMTKSPSGAPEPEISQPAVDRRPGFTGREGKQVAVADTVRGFKEILEGKHDEVTEGNFYMKGGIDEIKE